MAFQIFFIYVCEIHVKTEKTIKNSVDFNRSLFYLYHQ